MANLVFYAGKDGLWPIDGGSGIGFYGSAFGNSIRVGEFNETTYFTNPAGNLRGWQANNAKWVNSTGVKLDNTFLPLRNVPNQQATVNIRFTNNSAVNVQNAYLSFYDRSDINVSQSGVTVFAAEIIHPHQLEEGVGAPGGGSGNPTWERFAANGINKQFKLADSPGQSGYFAQNGSGYGIAATQHDWYLLLSASPDSIGSKTQFGLLFSLEYF